MELALSPSTYWLLGGGLLIALEVMGISGIGMVFAGLAAISVGLSLQWGWLANDAAMWQAAWFLLLTAFWALILWRPFKKLIRSRAEGGGYDNIIGGRVTAIGAIEAGKEGRVRWSGTDWRAVVEGGTSLAEGEAAIITAIEGNCLTVKSASAK